MGQDAIERSPSSIRAWRTRMGLDRAAAAGRLGVSAATLKSYEIDTGPRAVPLYIAKLAARLETEAAVAWPAGAPSDIHVIGGGTVSYVRNHLALCAPAYGTTAKEIVAACGRHGRGATLHLTRMADPASAIETNEDVGALVDRIVADPTARILFMNAALCDFDGSIGEVASGRHAQRLLTREGVRTMDITPADKIIGRIRKVRKDIFAIGFKTTTGATPDEQYRIALGLLKANSLNLVLANDPVTRLNMVVTPEEARYFQTTDRAEALEGLVKMALARSSNTFTRSTVIQGDSVPWSSDMIPPNLRRVVEHCIEGGAYKPFRGATVGHFAVRVDERTIVTSKRKHDFNRLPEEGMVLVQYEGRDRVIAHGAKPSVGGQSQRIVFDEHREADCIVHFHAPLREDARDRIPLADQWPNECGSHQCGENTSRNLMPFGNVKAVMLDEHGPNIVFSRDTPAEEVVAFIDANFDLSQKTGGPVS